MATAPVPDLRRLWSRVEDCAGGKEVHKRPGGFGPHCDRGQWPLRRGCVGTKNEGLWFLAGLVQRKGRKTVQLYSSVSFYEPRKELDGGGLGVCGGGIFANPLAGELEDVAEDLVLAEDVERRKNFGCFDFGMDQLRADREAQEIGDFFELVVYVSVLVELANLCEVAAFVRDEGPLAEGVEGLSLADEGVNLVNPGERVGFLRQSGDYSSDGLQAFQESGEGDYAIHEAALDERLANGQARGFAVRQFASGHDEAGGASGVFGIVVAEVLEKMKQPHGIGVAGSEGQRRGLAGQAEAGILGVNEGGAPAVLALGAVIEWRIGEDVVGLQVGVLVIDVGIAEADVRVEAVDEQVEAAEAVGEVFAFLAEEGEFDRCLHEESWRCRGTRRVGVATHGSGSNRSFDSGAIVSVAPAGAI